MTTTTWDGHCPEEPNREWCAHAISHWPPAQPGTQEVAPWRGGPDNTRDRARYLALSAEDRHRASLLAQRWDDGFRSTTTCWEEALDQITESGGE
ncbi:hypothetical protein FAF44_02710 [Nonomuraea sp. MG754425]|uniref:hypothetical protein n=1 Tax=Nonomuraea sp. MG754425 TaxID=2570319 RepID=UPI001F1DF6F1|nr:hypothetical protein [Nonomuraea sp. MG754425]MCF6467325.1 hypothetical protein [Nonomuraea sp. MG754425]